MLLIALVPRLAGKRFVDNYIDNLSHESRESIKASEPSKTVYQFGGGEQRTSIKKIGLPALIGDMKLTVMTEVVDADIPLLIGANSLEKSKNCVGFWQYESKVFHYGSSIDEGWYRTLLHFFHVKRYEFSCKF